MKNTEKKMFTLPRSKSKSRRRLSSKSHDNLPTRKGGYEVETGPDRRPFPQASKTGQSKRLIIPFFTVAKIKKMANKFIELKKYRRSNSPLKEDIRGSEAAGFLNISEDVLRDLSEANPDNHEFVRKGEGFKNGLIKKVGSWDDIERMPILSPDITTDIDHFGTFMLKLEPKIKEEGDDDEGKDLFGDKNFDSLTKYLGKIKDQAGNMDTNPLYNASSMMNGKQVDPIAVNRVVAFLKNYAAQLKDFDFEHAKEMASDAHKTVDKILDKKTPPNHVKGIVDTIDKVIDDMFLGFGGRDNVKNKVIDFGDFLRALMGIGSVKTSEALDMEIPDGAKVKVGEELNKLRRQDKLDSYEDPNFFDVCYKDDDKIEVKKLLCSLAKEILPPRKAKIASPTQSHSFEFDFLSYGDNEPQFVGSDYLEDSPKLMKTNFIDSDIVDLTPRKNNIGSDVGSDESIDDARKAFEDEIQRVKYLKRKAEKLNKASKKAIDLPEGREKEAKKVKLISKGADLVEKYSNCEKRMPEYTDQFKKANSDLESRRDSQPVFNQPERDIDSISSIEKIPVMKQKDVLELYPEYYEEMNKLRKECADLMDNIEKNKDIIQYPVNVDHDSEQDDELYDKLIPLYQDLKEDLKDGREVLGTKNPENTVKELEESHPPERKRDLDKVLSRVFKKIKKLNSAIKNMKHDDSESTFDDPAMAEKSARNMIEAAIEMDEVIKAAKNNSFESERSEVQSENESDDEEKDMIQREYDASKGKFCDSVDNREAKGFLKQNPVLKSLAEDIVKLGDRVEKINDNNPTRDTLERTVEDFIEAVQDQLSNNQNAQEMPQVFPSQRSDLESARLSDEEKNNLLKSIIIRNLKKMKNYNKKVPEGNTYNHEIDDLISDLTFCNVPNLDLIKTLKDFLRKMDDVNHKNKRDGNFERSEFENLGDHIVEASNAVDEIMRLKTDNLLKGVTKNSKKLGENGKKIEIDFAQKRPEFSDMMEEIDDVEDLDLSKKELKEIDKDLKIANANVYEALKNILETINQKSKDLKQHIKPLNKSKNVKNPDKVAHLKVAADDIINNVKSNVTPLGKKLRSIIKRVREIEKSNAEIQDQETDVDSDSKDLIDDDVFKLGDSKLDVFDLKDSVSSPVDNQILNTEEFLKKWPSRDEKGDVTRDGDVSRDKDFSFEGSDHEAKKKVVEEFLKDDLLSRNPDEILDGVRGRYHMSPLRPVGKKKKRIPLEISMIPPQIDEKDESLQIFNQVGDNSFRSNTGRSDRDYDDSFKSNMMDSGVMAQPGQPEPEMVEIEESFYMMGDEIQNGEKVDVVKRLIHGSVVPKGGDLDIEAQERDKGEYIEGVDDPNDWESYYIQADEKGRKLPIHDAPLFKRKMRRINSEDKLARGTKKPKLAKTFDDGNVIIESKLVPSGEWIDGKKLYKKKEDRKVVDGPLKLKNQIPCYPYFINCEGGKPYFAETVGKYKEYFPKYSNGSYVMLEDENKSIALIQLAERSNQSPIVALMDSKKFQTIPLFVKEMGQGPDKLPVYYHRQFEKLLAHEENGISRHCVWQIDKDPCVDVLSREEALELVETMKKSTPLVFYQETGEQIEGDRVIENLKLADLLNRMPELSSRRKLFKKTDDSRPSKDKYDVVFDPIGQTVEGKPVYEKKLVKKVVKPMLNPLTSSRMDRINRERSIEYLKSTDRDRASSRISKPVLEGLSKIGDNNSFSQHPIKIIDDSSYPYGTKDRETTKSPNKNDILMTTRDYQKTNPVSQIRYDRSPDTKENLEPIMIKLASDTEMSQSEGSIGRREKFNEALKNAENIPDAVELFTNEVEDFGAEDKEKLFKEMDNRFEDLVDEIEDRPEHFDDVIFPPGSSSMVNNSRKTDKDFANCDWKSMTDEIYEVSY